MHRWVWVLVILWATIIFFLSASPDAYGGFGILNIPFGDKLAHGFSFGVLALLIYFASKNRYVAFVLSSLYGISDEIHQSFVPGRTADVMDWLADSLGAIVVLLGVSFLTWYNKKRLKTLR